MLIICVPYNFCKAMKDPARINIEKETVANQCDPLAAV